MAKHKHIKNIQLKIKFSSVDAYIKQREAVFAREKILKTIKINKNYQHTT